MNKLFLIFLLLPCLGVAQTIKVPFKQIETATDSNYTIRSNTSGIFRPQLLPYNVFTSNNTAFGNRYDDGSKVRITGPLRLDLGGDQWGDMYYRDSLGLLTRIPRTNTNNSALTWFNGVPSWRRDFALTTVVADSLAALRAAIPVIPDFPAISGTKPLDSITTVGATSSHNIAIGDGTTNTYAINIERSNTDGGTTNVPSIQMKNTSATDPSGGGTNAAWFNIISGNGAVIGQVTSNYGTGQFAPTSSGSGMYVGTRTDHDLNLITGATTVIRAKINPSGLMLPQSSSYLNFSTTAGTSGYGIRDNAGTLQFKNSGGSWANLGSGGGTSQWTTSGSDIYVASGNVAIGTSTTTSDLTGVVLLVNGYIKATPGKGIVSQASGGFSTTLIRNTAADNTEYYAIGDHRFHVQGQERLRLSGTISNPAKLSYVGFRPNLGASDSLGIYAKVQVDSAIAASVASTSYAGEDVTIITASYTVPTTSKIINIIFEGAATGQTITLPTGSGADRMVIYLRNNTGAAVNFSQSIWETSGTSGTAVSGQTTYKLVYKNADSKWYSIPLEVNN